MLSWEKYGGYINPDGEFIDRLTPAQVFEMQEKAAARLAAIEEENKRKAQAEINKEMLS